MQSWLLFYNAIRYSVSQQLDTYLDQPECWPDVYTNWHALKKRLYIYDYILKFRGFYFYVELIPGRWSGLFTLSDTIIPQTPKIVVASQATTTFGFNFRSLCYYRPFLCCFYVGFFRRIWLFPKLSISVQKQRGLHSVANRAARIYIWNCNP